MGVSRYSWFNKRIVAISEKQKERKKLGNADYSLKINGVIAHVALAHVSSFRVDAALRAVSIVNSAFIDISTASLIVDCRITCVAFTTIAVVNKLI